MRKYTGIIFLLFMNLSVLAQDAAKVEMADAFRSEGKIYIVVTVILTILLGLFLYLIRIDRKLRRLENDRNHSA